MILWVWHRSIRWRHIYEEGVATTIDIEKQIAKKIPKDTKEDLEGRVDEFITEDFEEGVDETMEEVNAAGIVKMGKRLIIPRSIKVL